MMCHPNLFELKLRHGKYGFGECRSLRKLTMKDCDCGDYFRIAQLENLTSLKLSEDDSLIEMLQTSKSSETLEEFEHFEFVDDPKKLIAALRRFTNLKRFSLRSTDFDDNLLSEIPRLRKLRVLTIGGLLIDLTSDGLIDMVQRLPDLEQLSLVHCNSDNCIHLKEATYLRFCEIYRARNKKLVIANCFILWVDIEVDYVGANEPFAGADQRQFVQYMTLDDENDVVVFEI